MKKRKIYCTLLGLSSVLMYGQRSSDMINEGVFFVSSEDVVSVVGTFENTDSGDVINDGTTIYYQNFINDGLYGISHNIKTGNALFLAEGVPYAPKQITGNGISSFYNVEFNSPLRKVAFDLKNNMEASGIVDFKKGIVLVDSTYNPVTEVSHGMMTFKRGAQALNANEDSHVDGFVEKIGDDSFVFPIGHDEKFRPAKISASNERGNVFVGRYVYNDTSYFEDRINRVGALNKISTSEYWIVENSDANESSVLLTLSWDEETTSDEVLTNPEEDLHIVRWDEQQKIWVDEGGVVDMSRQEVTTIGTVKGYGVFTFGTVKKEWLLDGDIVVYNLVTADGDGKNDYFIIDHIKNYPNKVEIFNRWGARVYETTNYDPYGDGSTNVFRGYSEGKATVDKGAKLPSGTYYYVITYEYTDANGSRMIKKAANLHLETN